MPTEVIIGFASSIIGGLLVAIVNQLFTKRRTDAEAEVLKAQAEKIRAETATLLNAVGKLNTAIQSANYCTLYDGRQNMDLLDFQFSSVSAPKDPSKEIAVGTPKVKEGALMVERKNTAGRFFVAIRNYKCDGKEKEYIPKNELLEGQRRLRVTFEARATKG